MAACDVTARPGVKPEDLEAATDKEIALLREKGPTQAELDGARAELLTNKIRGLQRLGGFGGVADMMDRYNQYLGDPGYLPKDIARYQAVTTASVREIGQKVFGNNQRVVVYAVPGKKVTDDVPRSPEDTDAKVVVTPPYSQEFESAQGWRKDAPKAGPPPELHLPVPEDVRLEERAKDLPGRGAYPTGDQCSVGGLGGRRGESCRQAWTGCFYGANADRGHARPQFG